MLRNDIVTHTQTHTCYSLNIEMLRINDIMILKKRKSYISLKVIYTVDIHTRIQYMIIKILQLGGRISHIIGERRYSSLGANINICKVQLNVV